MEDGTRKGNGTQRSGRCLVRGVNGWWDLTHCVHATLMPCWWKRTKSGISVQLFKQLVHVSHDKWHYTRHISKAVSHFYYTVYNKPRNLCTDYDIMKVPKTCSVLNQNHLKKRVGNNTKSFIKKLTGKRQLSKSICSRKSVRAGGPACT